MEEVLLDRSVGFVDQLQAFIQQELGQPSPDEAMELALSSCCTENERQKTLQRERIRYRDEVQLPAFRMLRDRRRQAAAAAVRKEPLAFTCELDEDADYYRDMLDGTDPLLSRPLAGGVASLSLNIAWPPSRHPRDYPGTASVAGCHESLLLVNLGNCSPFEYEPGFYMVYNTRANSAAAVPRVRCGVSDWSHCHIARDGGAAGSAAVLCLGGGGGGGTTNDDDYLLVELLLRRRHRQGVICTQGGKKKLLMREDQGATTTLLRGLPCGFPGGGRMYSRSLHCWSCHSHSLHSSQSFSFPNPN